MRRLCAVALRIAITIGVAACTSIDSPPPQNAADSPPPQIATDPAALPSAVTCEGPFAKDTDHEKLLATFGAANVVFKEAHTGVEDITEMATVLYPQNPARRLKIFWQHREERKFPTLILIDEDESQWSAGQGLRLGLNVQEVQSLNGRPFRMSGFGTDFFGMAAFRGGALEHVRRDCVQQVRFGPYPNGPAPDGDTLSSSDPKVRSLGLKVIQIFVRYPKAP